MNKDKQNFSWHAGFWPAEMAGLATLVILAPDLLQQKISLGSGGGQLLKALGRKPAVCHFNEDHAAFGVLKRARALMQKTGLAFEAALAVRRPGNLLTTRTARAASFDHCSPALMSQFPGDYARRELGTDVETLLAPGRQSSTSPAGNFATALLAGSPFDSFLGPGLVLLRVLLGVPGLLAGALVTKPPGRGAERLNYSADMRWAWTGSI